MGLDGEVLKESRPALELREVSGGCICCTAGAALESALAELLEVVAPERILLEPSGVAKPGEIIDLLAGSEVGRRLELRPVICLVDPPRFLGDGYMDMPLYRDQVEAADILVANRCDLVDTRTVEAFEAKAAALFPPKAAVLHTSFGRLPLWVLEPLAGRDRRPRPTLAPAPADPGEDQGFETLGALWGPEVVFGKAALDKALAAWAESQATRETGHPPRFKGIFHTDGGWWLMEMALGHLHQRPVQHRRDSRCQLIVAATGRQAARKLMERLQAAVMA